MGRKKTSKENQTKATN
jgi:cytochrome b involved in lipid metabolism